MSSNRFYAKDIEYSLPVKLHCFFTAISQRRDTLKLFCQDENIDYPVNPDKKYHFPDKYFIVADEISYLANNRDKILISLYEDYKKEQSAIDANIITEKTRLGEELDYQEKEMERNKHLKQSKTVAKGNMEKLDLETKLIDSNTRLKNSKASIDRINSAINKYEAEKKANEKSWKNQTGIVDGVFETQVKKYIHSATKLIRKQLNYTKKYSYIVPEYSDEVRRIVGDN